MKSLCLLIILMSHVPTSMAGFVEAEPFFRESRIVQASISPSGEMVMLEVKENGKRLIEAVIPASRKSFVLTNVGETDISAFEWLGPTTLMFSLFVPEIESWRYVIANMKIKDGAVVDSNFSVFNTYGTLIDPLSADDDFMLFERFGILYKYPLHKPGKPYKYFKDKYFTNEQPPAFGSWFTDRNHVLRLIIESKEDANDRDVILENKDKKPVSQDENEDGDDSHITENNDVDDEESNSVKGSVRQFRFYDPETEKWAKTARLDADFYYKVIGFAEDNYHVIMISDYDRDTRAVMKFDPVSGEFKEELFSMPGIDIYSAALNSKGQLLSASYVKNGEVVQEYLNDTSKKYQQALNNTIGSGLNHAYLVSSSLNERYQLVQVYGVSERGRYYYIDSETNKGIEIGSKYPWLEGKTSDDVRLIKVKSADGVLLEGYLLMPAGSKQNEKIPLVVMPHGGPMGIRSTTGFDNTAQFLAANKIAVLKVNFRGSGGFGRAFLESGKQQKGTGIEDDIELLVETAIAQQPIDENRICAYGSSYGGYSSLILAVRNPHRYKCSASFAAPTDEMLLFTASDWTTNKDTVEEAKLWSGDPDTDEEEMRARSPVYLAEQYSTPLFIAQGGEDYRVDVEHYHRFILMLKHFGKDFEHVLYPESGHGFADTETSVDFHEKLLAFLLKHIGTQRDN